MKRKSIIMAVLAVMQLCSSLWALPTTAYEAEMVVTGWLKADSQPLGMAIGREVMRVETFTDDNGKPVYYIVYLQPSGFVIVSADDLVEPIIGFADDGIYNPSPDNPLGALVTNDLNGRIAAVRSTISLMAMTPQAADTKTQKKWSYFISLAETPKDTFGLMGLADKDIDDVRVAPLVKTKWDQDYIICYRPTWPYDREDRACYNYYTPQLISDQVVWIEGDPDNYPCGCGATAMAQLMRYHQYPAIEIGVHEFTIKVEDVEQTASTRGGDGNGGPYKWGQMVLEPGCSITSAQRQAIGALCFDAGIATETEYSASVSKTDLSSMASALQNTFKYSNTVLGRIDSDNVGTRLSNMANSNLDAYNPVIFRIWHDETKAGHFIVCDGYGYNTSALYHHFNMGWSGIDDAWYNLPNIVHPSYNLSTHCIYNIFTSGSGEIISGRVIDVSGNPISDAMVTAQGSGGTYTAVTDSKGIYALVGVDSDSTYTVNVTKPGYNFTPMQGDGEVETGLSMDWSSISGNKWGIDFVGTIDEGGCTTITIGTGTSDWYQPMHTIWHDSRTQVIYLANDIGRSGTITELALDVTTPPGQTMNNWTIRMKHTSMNKYDTCSLDANGWTVVYQNDETVESTGWYTFKFSIPFEYNGTSNLLVDFSHNNSSYTSNGKCMTSSPGGERSVYAYCDSNYEDPLNWSGSSQPTVFCSNNVPNVKLTICEDGAPLNVLICGANDDDRLEDIQQKLLGTGQFNTDKVSIMNVQDTTPTLSQLQTYDSVMIYGERQYQDATALGNVMADYVDSGGGVVCMMFEVGRGIQQYMMQGRWSSEEYYAIPRGGQYQSSRATLGAVHDPGHPIMQGVFSFDGGPKSYRPSTLDVMPDAVRIADWSDDRPLVVTKMIGSVRRVDLGFYPVSSDVDSDWWDLSTDGALLMANALTWVARVSADILMPLPEFSETFSDSTRTRGYWFEAPTNFRITGLRVPNESSNARQNVEVVRFDNQTPPPIFSNTTNAFVSLTRFVDEPSGNILSVNISVSTGDVIGVLGAVGTSTMHNSYGPGDFVSNIGGHSVTLKRMGMQFNLYENQARDLYQQESISEIGRVEMWYIVD